MITHDEIMNALEENNQQLVELRHTNYAAVGKGLSGSTVGEMKNVLSFASRDVLELLMEYAIAG